MSEFLIVAYLILGLIASVLIWAALLASKGRANAAQKRTDKSFIRNRFFRTMAEEE
jgi:hypothetical protein